MHSSDLKAPARVGLTIDAFFDFICPWCWIGTRHLASALNTFTATHPGVTTHVQWHAYPLLPDTPAEGAPYQAFYLARLGSPAAVAARRAQVQRAGEAAGIAFDFDRMRVLPNTQGAHSLVNTIRQRGAGGQLDALIERVFRAYFVEGEDIGNAAVLQRLESEHGIVHDTPPAARHADAAAPMLPQVALSGVPYFVFNGALAVSGAHPPSGLLHAMQRAISPPQ